MDQAAAHPAENLKGRQLDCMLLVKEGYSSKQIARELGISPRTVDQHIAAALETMGVSSRMAAVSQMYKLDQDESQAEPDRQIMLFARNGFTAKHLGAGTRQPRTAAILPPIGGIGNFGSRSDRLGWMIRIAIFCIMLTCAGILSVLAVTELASYSAR